MTEYGMLLTDLDTELFIEIFDELKRAKTKKVTSFHSPSSYIPKTFSEDVNPHNIFLSGSFISDVVLQGRKLDYLTQIADDILFIYFDRDVATYLLLSKGAIAGYESAINDDLFFVDAKTKGQIIGQVREAVDDRCITNSLEVTDTDAMRNKAIRLSSSNFPYTFPISFGSIRTIYFDMTQSDFELPTGDYEMLVRMKAEATDTAKMEVLNQDDTDEWASVCSPGAVNILCLKAFKDKLYAGTSDGKIYVSEDGTNFSLTFDTGTAEVHCFEESGDCLYAGTGNSGKIFKYDEAAWIEDYDTGETDVFCFKEFYEGLYAGTGANGKLFRLKSGTWAEYVDLAETSIFTLEIFENDLYAGTGANGKIERLVYGDALPVNTTHSLSFGYVSGLVWDGTNMWACDWVANEIYKLNADMTVNATYAGLGDSVFGLACDGTVIWSCGKEGGVGKIWKHNADMTENTEYNAPSNSPRGLTHDGTVIWSADSDTDKIYKHNADMTVNATYDTPAGHVYGLTHDGTVIWSSDIDTDKIYKHNADMTVDFSYAVNRRITGLAWDGNHIFGADLINAKIYKYGLIGTVYDSTDTNIYALKLFESKLYAGGDGGNVYKTSDGDSWSIDYATGETEIRGLFELGGSLYAGTGSNGKFFILNSSWSESHDLDDTHIYEAETFLGQYFIGTGADGNIYTYRNGILASEQKILTTTYAIYKLPFSITNLDAGDTIRFKIMKDGVIADWVNVDFISFVTI